MKKEIIKELKEQLEQRKKRIEEELKSFAKKDKKLKGDWDARYPSNAGGVGSQALEDAADQVEKYSNILALEHSLELQLLDINLALEKIKKGTYGKCENCGKQISIQRLKAYPEAKYCRECNKLNTNK